MIRYIIEHSFTGSAFIELARYLGQCLMLRLSGTKSLLTIGGVWIFLWHDLNSGESFQLSTFKRIKLKAFVS